MCAAASTHLQCIPNAHGQMESVLLNNPGSQITVPQWVFPLCTESDILHPKRKNSEIKQGTYERDRREPERRGLSPRTEQSFQIQTTDEINIST